MKDVAKTYDPTRIEPHWYQYWIERNYFHAEVDENRTPYCIMMPPPNVTGILHMGHALQSTIQDTLIRYHRMRNYNVLWMPGTDHAGIATQNVVERKLIEEGTSREEVGREKFVEEVWKWKDKHDNIISEQQKKLGSSCDWERERFTMDEGLSRAVRTVFVRLYEQELIYKGKYIVNWCPYHRTALSDEEVKHAEQTTNLWYIEYPLEDGEGAITVATTRPETMLGDTAVAVNPKDDRFKHLIGKTVILPVSERRIPVIGDKYVDTEFGTGAVKVTPAHDPSDFFIGLRHNLPQVTVIDGHGEMTAEAGKQFAGLDRFECREKLLDELKRKGYLKRTKDYVHNVGTCQRCSTIIEPLLSDQWFVKMKPLAEKSMEAVRKGEIRFHPEKWEKDFFYWMENIRDWCISRQLWWGHRIPVWYCQACNGVTVSLEDPTECSACGSSKLVQDEDVLDTWFSSWLWPLSTLNWPEDTPEMRYFYPTSVLVSAYDILFFWIARMIMAGFWFTGVKPFADVCITGMIKDELGRIMSKSLGNGIDPIEMVDLYGADAVRYSLVVLNTEGQDIKLSAQKFEMGRNFANKIWNAYRFLMLKEEEIDGRELDFSVLEEKYDLADRWIISRLHTTWRAYEERFRTFRLNEAANALYAFFWHDFCDWYIEWIKERMNAQKSGAVAAFRNIAMPVLKKAMELLHPVIPFITEEIWQNLGDDTAESIMITDVGTFDESKIDRQAEADMKLIQEVIAAIRNIRGEMNIPPTKPAEAAIKCSQKKKITVIEKYLDYIFALARVDRAEIGPKIQRPPLSATAVLPGVEIFVPLAGLIDIDSERKRLGKEVTRLQKQIKSINLKLTHKEFLTKAPPDVVEREREKLRAFSGSCERVKANLAALET